MQDARKDRFVAYEPHVAEELRVNRGGLGALMGPYHTHFAHD